MNDIGKQIEKIAINKDKEKFTREMQKGLQDILINKDFDKIESILKFLRRSYDELPEDKRKEFNKILYEQRKQLFEKFGVNIDEQR